MSRRSTFAPTVAVLIALMMTVGQSIPLAAALPLDSVPPVIQVQGVTDGSIYTHAVTPTVTSTDLDLASLQITLDGLVWTSGSVVGPGRHVIAATAVDTSGNTASESVSFIVDMVPPVLYFFLPNAQRVDVGLSDVDVTFLFQMSDDFSGIDMARGGVELYSPNGVPAEVVSPIVLVSGDPLTGRGEFAQTVRIPMNSEPGVWVPQFRFYDRAGYMYSFDVSCDLFGFGGGKNVAVSNTTEPVDLVDVAFLSVTPRPATAGAPITLTAVASDSLSHPVASYEWYSNIDGPLGTSAAPVFVAGGLSVATHRLSVRARCADGTLSDRVQFPLPVIVGAAPRLDTTAPSTGSDAVAQYQDSATIALMPFDFNGSGVEHTYYRLDGGDVAEGTSVTTAVGGPHNVDFWSVDGAGNVEEAKTVSFTVVKPLTLATVGRPVAPATARHGVAFKVYGYVWPAHSSGTYLATLQCYRYQSGHWVLRKTVKAVRSAYTSAASKYSANLSLPYAGKWRIRAYHSDALHAGRYSGYDYVTVR